MAELTEKEIEKRIRDAVDANDAPRVRKLLEQHPEFLNHYYNNALTFLIIACQAQHQEVVQVLLDLGCEVDKGKRRNPEETPLFCALGRDNPQIARLLLQRGANPNGNGHVITAIVGPKKHSLELVKLLEKHGADLHAVDVNDFSGKPMNALTSAIDWGKQDVADYLESKGCVLPGEKP
jgi:ankyrin repeat protein